jgi:hypothetical protein
MYKFSKIISEIVGNYFLMFIQVSILQKNLLSFSDLKIILKTRCEMLYLGSKPWNN